MVATLTTRSLNEFDGLTESSLTQIVPSWPSAFAEVVGAAQRREPGAEVDALDARPTGQQRLVAPQGVRTGFRLLAEVDPVDRLQVVGGLERTEALLADRERLDRVLLAADAALQRRGRGDRRVRTVTRSPPRGRPSPRSRAYFASAPCV